ncbi:von Willebrand factor type A domain-containing protein [Micromonospora kangleipakensis]|uniref:von Willebrand factor type A domain-containing protein n=1 Tax=Micromonospora kangleipakensis TaxID=1077942 RepID=A0A4Q8B7G2_9ACTN|nr:substrate-binding domain-containing protein [Micromonospora kangleipakensis]RZU73597.1 von Willebrand factor type A domain-containing protein [Micromonospora kangleipakensis]
MPGRHRNVRRFPKLGAIAAAVALTVVVSGVSIGLRQVVASGCTGQTPLTVAVAPEIAPAVLSVAGALAERARDGDGACVQVSVSAVNPVDVAAVLAARHGASLAGVGQGSGATPVPDVWIPDSSTWLSRLRSAASGFAPTNDASIARSPIVVAVPEPVAGRFGWPEKKLTWADLRARITSGAGLNAGLVEPTRDAAGLSGLLSLSAAAGSATPQATMAALRALANGRSEVREDLTARFPRSADPAALGSGLALAVLSEEDVIAFNSAKPLVPMAALYVEPAPVSLDYPFAVMPGIDPTRASAAEALYRALDSRGFRDRLGPLGIRPADGAAGAGFAAPDGAPTSSPGGAERVVVPPASVDRVLSTWSAVVAPAQMLAVIDVSGTMGGKVPTAGNATRMQVTLEAAKRGLGLFNDDWAVGLWIFSTRLDGERDYRQLVPIGPLSTQRERMVGALGQIRPKPRGDTGLYDTILAAYQQMQADWQPGRVNSVVVLTDGIGNDDPDGISLQALTGQLTTLKDATRPVQLIILGMGDAVNRAPLDKITAVTGGGVLIAKDPAMIGDVFLKAISLRPATG